MTNMKEKNAYEKIYDVIRGIPEGKVASYGQVAELAGNRRWVRVVGYALHALPPGSDVPWHRVVTKENYFAARTEVAAIFKQHCWKKKG